MERNRTKFAPGAIVGILAAFFVAGAGPSSEIRFRNELAKSTIGFVEDNSHTSEKHVIETMTGGVAAFDFNNDGRIDLFFVNGAQIPQLRKSSERFWNRLYRNDGQGRFTDVTAQAGVRGVGYSMGVAAGDYNNDGLEDLFVAGANANQLLRNNGDGTFTDITAHAGVEGVDPKLGKLFSVGAGWLDYNNDGLLDLFVVNYVRWSLDHEPPCSTNNLRAYCSPDNFEGLASTLYRNNGDGTFTDVSQSSGIGRVVGKGMGVAFADYDGDGWTDIFVANDTFRNLLFHNNRDGTFTEAGIISGVAYNEDGKSIAGMGADFRDIDNDGKPDILVTGTLGDTFPLFRNEGREFSDQTSASGLAALTTNLTGWSSAIADFDNDGWKDIFTSNSAILDNSDLIDHRPYKLSSTVFRQGRTGRFTRVAIDPPDAHRGAALADLDGDGRLDIVINCLNGPPEILMNRSPAPNHWLIFDLRGTRSNRDGFGARIELATGSLHQFNYATSSVGYGSSSDRRVHFGLGSAARADHVRIVWPSGKEQVMDDIAADRVVKVVEP